MRTISDLITACGGPEKIVEAAGSSPRDGKPSLTHWAVRKWPKNGIPEWHWPVVMSLVETTPFELHAANEQARASEAA